MAPQLNPRRPWQGPPYQHDSSFATFVALLLAVGVPALFVALVAGWRPLDPGQADALGEWVARATGRGAAAAQSPATSWAVPDGWFYTEVYDQRDSTTARGHAVTNGDGMPFWSEYQRLGGPTLLGYPISRRFSWNGGQAQVFQRGVLLFDPASGKIAVVRLLDRLHAEGADGQLAGQWGIPELELPPPAEPSAQAASDRLASVLADYPALRAYLAAAPDPDALFGLPTSTVRDVGAFYAVRFQAGALQQWKEDVPWARAGEVTAANVGELAAALGALPSDPLAPVVVARPSVRSGR